MKLIKTLGNCLDNHITHIYLKDNDEYWIKTKFRFFPVKNLIQIGEKYYIPFKIIVEIAKHTDLNIYQLSNHQYYQQEYLNYQTKFSELSDFKSIQNNDSKLEQLDNTIQEYLDIESILETKTVVTKLTNPIQLEQLVNHNNPDLRLIAANSLLLTSSQVQLLINDIDPHVRASMVLSPLLTMKQFTKLSKDKHFMVQGLVASSQFITMEKMEHLIQNGNFDIKSSIARSPYLDEYPNLVEMLKLENDKRILKLIDYIGL